MALPICLKFVAAASGLGVGVLHGSVKLTCLEPQKILMQRLVKRRNTEIAQAKVRWVLGLSTWEDVDSLKLHFPDLLPSAGPATEE